MFIEPFGQEGSKARFVSEMFKRGMSHGICVALLKELIH